VIQPAALAMDELVGNDLSDSRFRKHFIDLGNRVRSLSRQRGSTQAEMAEMLGIGRSYLSEIENGKKDPRLRVPKTFPEGFKLSLSQPLRGF
jgi:DNA-binding XRE family transcriptional regulator